MDCQYIVEELHQYWKLETVLSRYYCHSYVLRTAEKFIPHDNSSNDMMLPVKEVQSVVV